MADEIGTERLYYMFSAIVIMPTVVFILSRLVDRGSMGYILAITVVITTIVVMLMLNVWVEPSEIEKHSLIVG